MIFLIFMLGLGTMYWVLNQKDSRLGSAVQAHRIGEFSSELELKPELKEGDIVRTSEGLAMLGKVLLAESETAKQERSEKVS